MLTNRLWCHLTALFQVRSQSISSTAHANFPNIDIPENRIDAAPGVVPRKSGSFGPCTTVNHNVYECYASPLISARLVAATIEQNKTRNFGVWEPLPPDLAPAGSVPNQNLIGYREVEILNAEGQQKLRDILIPNGKDMASRLKWCPALNGLVFEFRHCRSQARIRKVEGAHRQQHDTTHLHRH